MGYEICSSNRFRKYIHKGSCSGSGSQRAYAQRQSTFDGRHRRIRVAVEELGDTVIETGSKAVCTSTYNGIAYSFAKEMIKRFKALGINVPIVMGGRLNEPMDGSELPVDVSDKLAGMGINVDNDIDKTVGYLTGVLGIA